MKRSLTSEEISDIVESIQPTVHNTYSIHTCNRIRKDIESSLRNVCIYPEKIPDLKRRIIEQYHQSQVHPGDSVGILTAQSIGERQTQLSLDSFHSTGITNATVVTGVPRFNELVNCTQHPKNVMTKILLKYPYTSLHHVRSHVNPRLKHITMKDILDRFKIHPKRQIRDVWYRVSKLLYNKRNTYRFCIRCFFDTSLLYVHRITLEYISTIIERKYNDVLCIWSPTHYGIVDIWYDHTMITTNEKLPVYDRHFLYIHEHIIPELEKLYIQGIEGITNTNYVPLENGRWMVEAQGFNLKRILSMDYVDSTKTISNHIWEMFRTLGIEAVRTFLIHEFHQVISVDSYINSRHIELLVDVMLFTGTISSISRYGVHKNQSGALSKCSFEESLDQILKAGIYGEKEHIIGVSGAIICGKLSNVGTGMCDLMYDDSGIR